MAEAQLSRGRWLSLRYDELSGSPRQIQRESSIRGSFPS
jgi:hypothetical protein